MKVIFIHGPAAAGKYTVGSKLADMTGLPLFHNHLTVDLVLSLFEFGTPGFVELREALWLDAFRVAAKASRSFIFTFHPEATVTPGFVAQAQRVVRAGAGDLVFVELRCAPAIIRERLGSADRAAFKKLTDVSLYNQLEAGGSFQYPKLPDPSVIIDTAAMNPETAAAAIKTALSL